MSIRILIVDDALFTRRMLARVFAEQGWVVVGEAENGHEAVSQFAALQPDVVTMDITMPGMDGIVAVQQIVASHPNACIVMCSALGQQDKLIEAVKAGARGFIAKPFRKDRVIEEVKGVLKLAVWSH